MNKLLMEKDGVQGFCRAKKLSQWFFDITKFSENLLQGLDELNNWPEKVKVMQRNWIGKSLV